MVLLFRYICDGFTFQMISRYSLNDTFPFQMVSLGFQMVLLTYLVSDDFQIQIIFRWKKICPKFWLKLNFILQLCSYLNAQFDLIKILKKLEKILFLCVVESFNKSWIADFFFFFLAGKTKKDVAPSSRVKLFFKGHKEILYQSY